MRALLAFVLSLTPAHSWYSNACCGEMDCFPVACDQITEVEHGNWMYLPTGNVFGSEQIHPSKDKNCHVCLSGGKPRRSICAYIQQGA